MAIRTTSLELARRDAVLLSHGFQGLSGAEHGQGVLEAGAAATEDRQSEPSGRVDDDLRHGVRREFDQPWVPVRAVPDTLEVGLDDLVEHAPAVADDDDAADGAGALALAPLAC